MKIHPTISQRHAKLRKILDDLSNNGTVEPQQYFECLHILGEIAKDYDECMVQMEAENARLRQQNRRLAHLAGTTQNPPASTGIH